MLGAAPLIASLSAGAQAYFTEDFDTGDTAAHEAKGWVFGKNDLALEGGTDFGVVTAPFEGENFPSGQIPGTSNTDPDTGAPRVHPASVNGKESTGGFLISDSDKGSGSDDAGSGSEFYAITPSFGTTGSTEAWFHADAELLVNNNGECIMEVAASIDGGTNWITMFALAEPQRPYQSWQRWAAQGLDEFDGSARIGGYPQLGSASLTKTWTGVHGRWHLKLPAEANNKPDVKLRVLLLEAGDAWYIALDNIVVDNNPPPQGSQVILQEQFENGIPATWKTTSDLGQNWGTEPLKDEEGNWLRMANGMPTNIDLLREIETRRTEGYELPNDAITKWDTESFNTYPDLITYSPNGATDGRWILMLAGGKYALWQEGTQVEEVSHLDTPALDLSNVTGVVLDFLSEYLPYNDSAQAYVQVSVDGGQNFTEIFTYRGSLMELGEAGYFMRHYIPVPAADGKNNVVFRFTAAGGDPEQYRGFWAIDDVRVTASGGTTTAPTLSVSRSGANAVITFEGTLQSADTVSGPYANVAGATSPWTVEPGTAAGARYYRAVR